MGGRLVPATAAATFRLNGWAERVLPAYEEVGDGRANPARIAWWVTIGLVMLGCRDQSRPPPPAVERPTLEEHVALGASFVSNDSGALRRLLDSQMIVQPPLPDSARKGAAAIEYLLRLAAGTSVSESRLEPHMAVPEGPFVLEQGAWVMRNGDVLLRAPYSLRWRATAEGWRVVLWRWGAFR